MHGTARKKFADEIMEAIILKELSLIIAGRTAIEDPAEQRLIMCLNRVGCAIRKLA